MILRIICLLGLCAISASLHAERLSDQSSPLPQSYVADRIGLLAADSKRELDRLASALDDAGLGQVTVVVINSTEGVDHRQFATDLFNRWGVGDAQRNDGTLILLAHQDRAAEIVLGSGIDSPQNRNHTDAIMDQVMLPQFRRNNPDLAVINGVTALLKRVYALDLSRPTEQFAAVPATPPETAAQPVSTPAARAPAAPALQSSEDEPTAWGFLMIVYVVGAALVCALLYLCWLILKGIWQVLTWFGRGGTTLWWFTGSRWYVRRCPNCAAAMELLSDEADDAHLSPGELMEERLKSVDHRVYRCPACERVEKLARRTWFSRYQSCDQCGTRALSSQSHTLKSATEYSTGLLRIDTQCGHCGMQQSEERALARISRHRSSSGSGRSFGGGSSSGGGSSGRW